MKKKIQIHTRHNVTKIMSQCHTESDAFPLNLGMIQFEPRFLMLLQHVINEKKIPFVYVSQHNSQTLPFKFRNPKSLNRAPSQCHAPLFSNKYLFSPKSVKLMIVS